MDRREPPGDARDHPATIKRAILPSQVGVVLCSTGQANAKRPEPPCHPLDCPAVRRREEPVPATDGRLPNVQYYPANAWRYFEKNAALQESHGLDGRL